jgi:hypothetical protein
MNRRVTSLFAALALGALAVPAHVFGSIQLGINGDAEVSSNFIDFGQYPNGAPYTPPPGYGTFEVSLVNAGLFSSAGVTTGEFGTIQSLNGQTGPVTLPGPFMTFDTGGSNIELFATNIPAGTSGPLILTDTPTGAVAAFSVDGYVYDTNTQMQTEYFNGTFAATFVGTTVADLLNSYPIDTPFSATFQATTTNNIPEPASLSLLGISGLVLARRNRRTA